MDIELKINIDEVNAILQTLGNLPTSSGVWPLVVKIEQQAKAQVAASQDAVDEQV